jgi:hypothetical protein
LTKYLENPVSEFSKGNRSLKRTGKDFISGKKTTKVIKEEISINKSYYGITKIDESSLTDVVSRFDGYITKLNANKKYMTIKKGEPLYSIYSQEILSIQNSSPTRPI